MLWSVDGLGKGWSSASVAGDTVYLTGMTGDRDGRLFAFTLKGKPKWQAPYGKEDPARKHDGARTTPTVDGDRLYLFCSTGRLVRFEAKAGKKLLDSDTFERFGGKQLTFAVPESPLIDGDNVIVTPGGPGASLVAINKTAGETEWTTKGLSEESCYCSPNLVRVGDRRLIVMLQLSADGSSVTEKWTERSLDCQKEGVVILDGHVYGAGATPKGVVCLELATGTVKWTAKETGPAVVVAADDMPYIYPEGGTMRLAKATPAGYEEVGSFEVTQGTGEHWAHPTIAHGRLYLRHGDALMVYDVSAG